MSSNDLMLLGIDAEELMETGTDYHNRFFNNEDMEDFLRKFEKLMKSKDSRETFTFFQQVKIKEREEWVWHIASTKIFLQDKDGNPTHMVTIAIPIDQMKHIPNKAERLLAENDFFRANLQKYLSQGNRVKKFFAWSHWGKVLWKLPISSLFPLKP